MHATGYRIAVDIGGTFTDGVLELAGGGRVLLAKRLTTPGDPSIAVEQVVADLLALFEGDGGCAEVVHGTTLVTNAIIERKGARVGLLVTEGTGDVLEIGRELRYDLYDLDLELPLPLVPRGDIAEVAERMTAAGEVLRPLDDTALDAVAAWLEGSEIDSLAVCLLHACVNPAHEQAIGDFLGPRFPDLPISLSSRVAAEVREYERMSTTVANAYVRPMAGAYVGRLKDRLGAHGIEAPLRIMVSSGGFTSDTAAAEVPIALLESGPAGGVRSAVNTARAAGIDDVLTFDMGGTTAKACVVVGGEPGITYRFEAARVRRFAKGSGLPILSPSIDLIEIGAGGGSIARANALGLLGVGPESAGAEPGPACYDQGGEAATVTDADLMLGYLDAEDFLGGRMALAPARARAVIETLGGELGLAAIATAWGIHDVVNENMAGAARVHIAEKGLDPRRLAMVATGGAGPVHGIEVAGKLGISRVLFTIAAGVGSCLGFLAAPARVDRSWSSLRPLEAVDWRELAGIAAGLEAGIAEELASAGLAAEAAAWTLGLEARYLGQGDTVLASLPHTGIDAGVIDAMHAAFQRRYEALFGGTIPDGMVQAVTWRLAAETPAATRDFRLADGGAGAAGARRREIYLPASRAFAEVPVFDRHALAPGTVLDGPLILREDESTIVVARPARVEVLENGTVSVLLSEEGAMA